MAAIGNLTGYLTYQLIVFFRLCSLFQASLVVSSYEGDMTRCNLPIIIIAAILGATAASFTFTQWGNNNEVMKRAAVMYMLISMVSVSTILMLWFLLISEYILTK